MNGQNNNYEHEKSADELKEYIKEFSAGNKDAFDEIVRYQLPQLKNLAKIILNSPHDAEDVVQEALIKAYRSLDRFRGDAKITTWLCRIVINQAKNSLNSNYKRKTVFLEDQINQERLKSAVFGMEEADSENASRENLMDAINQLPEKYQSVVKMRLAGLSYNEIAASKNCSAGTIKSQLSRAKKLLREKLRYIDQEK